MITTLRVKGFKRFSDQSFKFSPLTILTGVNGGGKTSLIQTLLLLQQARAGTSIPLNGPFGLQLGTADDIGNWDSDTGIEITAKTELGIHSLQLSWEGEDSMYLSQNPGPNHTAVFDADSKRSFTYLAAERMGPRDHHPAASTPADELEVGFDGRNCAQLLAEIGLRPMEHEVRRHPDTAGVSFLKYEVEKWLSAIARPVEINAERAPSANIYQLRYRDTGNSFITAPNMGFGVTFALPIIVAGLIAARNGMLIVENPEAHLHPSGQSSIGIFLAWLASKGVQVVVETHSDHVVNGIRRAIGERSILKAADATVHFFGGGACKGIETLAFNQTGGISHWPKGFFDQFIIDTASITRFQRKMEQ